jgi:hypothetical protein
MKVTCNFLHTVCVCACACVCVVCVCVCVCVCGVRVCVCGLSYPTCNEHAPCHVSCPALQYFSTLSHKRHNFRKKVTEHKMCVFIFSTPLPEIFVILRRTEGDIIQNVYCFLYKVPVILVRFDWKLIFLNRCSHYTHISNFMKIRSVGDQLFHVDGETDGITKLIVAFRNFSNAPKKHVL